MPSLVRLTCGHPAHRVTLRCSSRTLVPDALGRGKFPLALHHDCLMTNRVHPLFEVGRADTLSAAMHWPSGLGWAGRAPSRAGRTWAAAWRASGGAWAARSLADDSRVCK